MNEWMDSNRAMDDKKWHDNFEIHFAILSFCHCKNQSGIKPQRTDQKEKFGLFFCYNRGKVMQNANLFA